MRWFVRQSIKRGRLCIFTQNYKSKICHDILKNISEEFYVEGKIFDIFEAYMIYKNNLWQNTKKEYGSKFDVYTKIDIEERENYINKKLGDVHIHHLIRQIHSVDLLVDFDATTLYPSAMSDEKSIYHKIETGFAYGKDMNDEFVENSILVILVKELLY